MAQQQLQILQRHLLPHTKTLLIFADPGNEQCTSERIDVLYERYYTRQSKQPRFLDFSRRYLFYSLTFNFYFPIQLHKAASNLFETPQITNHRKHMCIVIH